jgi:dihydrodipicolinate synthase/N-acetylneuraminate lyase
MAGGPYIVSLYTEYTDKFIFYAMEQHRQLPKGLWPVMLTPLKEDNGLDLRGLQELTDIYLQAGASGLFTNCLSGEMYQLTAEERLIITRTVVKQSNGRVPVVASGTSVIMCRLI